MKTTVEFKYCDLIFWSPKPKLDHLIIRTDADVNFWNRNKQRAERFHEQIMIPEILGKSFTRTGHFESTLPTGRFNSNDRSNGACILVHELESSGISTPNDASISVHELKSSGTIQNENDANNGIDYSLTLTNLFKEFGDFNGRNLMKHSNEEILRTFFDHEDQLKLLYQEEITQLKRNYRSKDLPFMIALEIVNERQLEAMVVFAEEKLANNLDEESNSTDVIFDSILPEWALAAFCKKFNYTRTEAL